jgi:hypothetical protein
VSENIVDKTLEVLAVSNTMELATGEVIFQVTLGRYIDNSGEILSRIPPNMREIYSGKKIAVIEVSLFIKKDQIPYRVGSKWRLKIRKNGTLNLVEAK